MDLGQKEKIAVFRFHNQGGGGRVDSLGNLFNLNF